VKMRVKDESERGGDREKEKEKEKEKRKEDKFTSKPPHSP